MDVGSCRFVAMNRFQNTLNAFTGIDWQWIGADNGQFRTFYTLPIQRLIDDSTLDNEPAFDREHEEVSFWGLYYSPAILPWGDNGEVYLFGLDEEDVVDMATRDREFYTAGFRLYREAKKGSFDYRIELAYQWGDSHSSTASTVDLDHFARFQHLKIDYTFDTPMSPQLLFQRRR